MNTWREHDFKVPQGLSGAAATPGQTAGAAGPEAVFARLGGTESPQKCGVTWGEVTWGQHRARFGTKARVTCTAQTAGLGHHRMTESIRLDKTSELTESHLFPNSPRAPSTVSAPGAPSLTARFPPDGSIPLRPGG